MDQLDLSLGNEGNPTNRKTPVRMPEAVRHDVVARMADVIMALLAAQQTAAKDKTEEQRHE